MPFYRVNGLMVHLNLGGKLRKHPPAPCCGRIAIDGIDHRCMAISEFLCDGEVSDGRTCDAPLCPEHATQIGPDRHLCARHVRERDRQPGLL